MRIFFRNGYYYTRFLNAVFQTPSVFDLALQDGPRGLGWNHYRYIEKPWHRIRIVIKMP